MKFKAMTLASFEKMEEAAEKADADRYQAMRDGKHKGSLGSQYGNVRPAMDMKKHGLRTESQEDSLNG
jgi:hypothetical protein